MPRQLSLPAPTGASTFPNSCVLTCPNRCSTGPNSCLDLPQYVLYVAWQLSLPAPTGALHAPTAVFTLTLTHFEKQPWKILCHFVRFP